MRVPALLLLVCAAGSTTACGRGGRAPGPVTPASGPGATGPSSTAALPPAGSADATSGPLHELTLTWSSEDEALLERDLAAGLAVVRRAGGQTYLLKGCLAPGRYQPDPGASPDATVRSVEDDVGPHPAGGRRVASLKYMVVRLELTPIATR
ncbi:MAG: hypothetical protein WKG00_07305 [Polyangiaceae bacterium]